MRVLLVEDEPEMAELVAHHVRNAGWIVDRVGSIDEARVALRIGHYAIMLLDRRLPDGDGIGLLPHLREFQPGVPVIVLTALDDVNHKVGGLDAGADDYLTKPFSFTELLARLRALVRRGESERPTTLAVGDLRLDPASRRVFRGEVEIELSTKEFAVLEVFIRRPGHVLSRLQILEQAWDYDYELRSNIVDVYIRYVRRKIDKPFGVRSLETVRGAGYRLRRDGGR